MLSLDGASQALVTITAKDGSGKPVRNISFRAEISVGGVRADFGSLSARNVVTDANGRATLVYTAPAAPAGPAVDPATVVDILVTPIGSDFANANARLASIRLVAARRRDTTRRIAAGIHLHAERADRSSERSVRRVYQHGCVE